ncbi:uncharacterized protein LOC125378379 [Haliotis rufescens]|uniref:uncharacterized protein LOC125378379 n=1 Tax=Haliotis rufescens TaxID=6454 RepID=UPI00201E872B|nr:uncharacterized protein LOC125378379 [Haliotis rufescens]
MLDKSDGPRYFSELFTGMRGVRTNDLGVTGPGSVVSRNPDVLSFSSAHSGEPGVSRDVTPRAESGAGSTNQGTGDSLTFQADAISAHVRQVLRERVWRGEFVELTTLLPGAQSHDDDDDDAFKMQMDSSGTLRFSPAKPANARALSIGQWTSAFHIYMSIYVVKHFCQSTIQVMFAYMETIRNAAVRSGGFGWSYYDQQFRHRMARDPIREWGKIDGELWLKHMTPTMSRVRENKTERLTVPFSRGRDLTVNACWDYNRSRCARPECKFIHKCSNCGEQHPAYSCFRAKGGRRPSKQLNSTQATHAKGTGPNSTHTH